jgi:hypothetical protein
MSKIPSLEAGVPAPVSPPPYIPSIETQRGVYHALEIASEGRRRPLRGKHLIGIARKAGLNWADTGTGYDDGLKLLASDKTRYIVGPSGSFINIDKHLFPKKTKKQRCADRRAAKSLFQDLPFVAKPV